MRWLITGGLGFIGKNLVQLLRKNPENSIRIIDNFSNPEALSYIDWPYHVINSADLNWESSYVQVIRGDILDNLLAVKVCQDADVIVHLAANTGVEQSTKNPRFDCETNVIGTLNYLEAAKHNGIKRFVFASSGAPAGAVMPPIHEEVVPHPLSPYGASKLAGEAYCSAFYYSFGVDTVALRFSNVYGPLSKHKSSVIAQFMKNLLEDKPLVINGGGSQTRDFIFVTDLVRAIEIVGMNNLVGGGEIFQVGTGKEISVNELINQLINIAQNEKLPTPTLKYASMRTGDMQRNYVDNTKIQSVFNWKPCAELGDGIQQTWSWFLENQLLSSDSF